jgi:ComF family protein
MHPLWRGLLDVIYPPRCEACGRLRRELICGDCRRAIEPIGPPLCRVCGEPFDPGAKAAALCPDCRGHPRAFAAARSAAYYSGPLVEAIRRFKYHCQMALWRPLGQLMVESLEGPAASLDIGSVDAICPVPLHEAREGERGFNQSELLAEVVADATGKPLKRLLIRTRPTLPQVDLPARSRAANVRGAFAADLHEAIDGQIVLLIDDLFTTGATMTECARTLRRAGAREVRVLTLARPLPRWRMSRVDTPDIGGVDLQHADPA